MLTCTLASSTPSVESADTWQVVTLRISSGYPQEPPSVVVRMSRDAKLAPQVCLVVSFVVHRSSQGPRTHVAPVLASAPHNQV